MYMLAPKFRNTQILPTELTCYSETIGPTACTAHGKCVTEHVCENQNSVRDSVLLIESLI